MTDDLGIINLVSFVGTTFFAPRFENVVPFNLQFQMDSNANQDLVALALQIQTLVASVEELTRQN